MLPYQERVVREKEELDNKISSLEKFIAGPVYSTLPQEEKWRMYLQHMFMAKYSEVLDDRIVGFLNSNTDSSISIESVSKSSQDVREFLIKIQYFKETGKFYTDAQVPMLLKNVGTEESPVPYMLSAVAKIRGLRDSGGQDSLPGLSGSGWKGYILVDCEEGYPCLIIPPHVPRE